MKSLLALLVAASVSPAFANEPAATEPAATTTMEKVETTKKEVKKHGKHVKCAPTEKEENGKCVAK